MDHLAIMNPKWKLIPKILSGEKTIESRRYMMKVAPRNSIKAGDTVYFKDAGKEVTMKAEVEKVIQFERYSEDQLKEILGIYGGIGGIAFSSLETAFVRANTKRYGILVFLQHPQTIEPFQIDKTGYGISCARITLPDIAAIRR